MRTASNDVGMGMRAHVSECSAVVPKVLWRG